MRWYHWIILFEHIEENAIAVNGSSYRDMITDFLYPQLGDDGGATTQASPINHLSRRKVSGPHNFAKFRRQLTPRIARFDTPRLFSLNIFERQNVYQIRARNIHTKIATMDTIIQRKKRLTFRCSPVNGATLVIRKWYKPTFHYKHKIQFGLIKSVSFFN